MSTFGVQGFDTERNIFLPFCEIVMLVFSPHIFWHFKDITINQENKENNQHIHR